MISICLMFLPGCCSFAGIGTYGTAFRMCAYRRSKFYSQHVIFVIGGVYCTMWSGVVELNQRWLTAIDRSRFCTSGTVRTELTIYYYYYLCFYLH